MKLLPEGTNYQQKLSLSDLYSVSTVHSLSWLPLFFKQCPEFIRLMWSLFCPFVFPYHHQKTRNSLAIINVVLKSRNLRDILEPLSNQQPG